MTAEREIQLIEEIDGKMLDIIKLKRNDYATDDVLSNFKRISEAARVLNLDVQTPVGYASFMVLLKLDRINNLLTSGKEPSNESVDDSFFDGINYLKLAYACFKENEDKKGLPANVGSI